MKLLGMVGLLLLAQAAAAARLVAGPMAGPPDLRSVGLWLQADGATRARIEAWPVDRPLKKQQVERLNASIEASILLFNNARANYLEVLTARRDSLEAQLQLIEIKQQQLNASVGVYQALGGDWR